MFAETRQKELRVTPPKKLVKRLGLNEGDKAEFTYKDGALVLEAFAVYPQEFAEELAAKVKDINELVAAGKYKVYSSVEEAVKEHARERADTQET